MILDTLKPYLQIIKIVTYVLLASFLFVGGCNYGKHKQTVAIAELKSQLGVLKDSNNANMDTIKTLKQANKDLGEQALADKVKADKVVKDWELALERAESAQKRTKKDLSNAYAKNKTWADMPIPADIGKLLNKPD